MDPYSKGPQSKNARASEADSVWDVAAAGEIIAEHARREGALLPILHALQDAFGYIDAEAIAPIAAALNFSRAEIYGTITFYDDFRIKPVSGRIIRVCRAEACQANGCEEVLRDLARLNGVVPDVEPEDGGPCLQSAYCLGNCALGPSALVDGEAIGRIDARALADLCAGAGAQTGESVEKPEEKRLEQTPVSAVRLFVSQDAAALSVGANDLARAILNEARRRGLAIEILRVGSRGMLWAEPMVEAETAQGRVAYGPLTPMDAASLFDADFLRGGAHPARLGLTEQMSWMRAQTRQTFARCGLIEPLSFDAFRAHGGLRGIEAAIRGADIIEALKISGLRGRGGAGFPTGVKWSTVRDAQAPQKYIVCNADEGDSGAFADRMLMEGDPFLLIEGMAIAALAVGARKGYIYIRSEYPRAFKMMNAAIEQARAHGLIGPNVLGTGQAFDLEARLGAGAYICGEETSLLESLEGKRGLVRAKPPIPALSGLFGAPTIVNNVLTFAAVPGILADGPDAYAALGRDRSRGTLAVQLGGDVKRGGLIEIPFGISLRAIIEDFGRGTRSGRPLRAVQIGGPLGAYLPAAQLDVALDYESLSDIGAMLGHGGVVAFADGVDMAKQARFAYAFCARESCGKCTPCRIGAVRGTETMDQILAARGADDPHKIAENLRILEDLNQLMTDGSLCAMGGLTPMPVMSALKHFPEDFRVQRADCAPSADGGQKRASP